jgi:hypothetical protein
MFTLASGFPMAFLNQNAHTMSVWIIGTRLAPDG